MDVTFFLGGEQRLAELERIDPDRDDREFQTGERAWVLQTYLRLKSAGFAATLRDTWPQHGLLVFDSRQRHTLQRMAHIANGVTLVGCRRDVGQALIADFEVLQNGRFANGAYRHFIPHWPQPGLIPRDVARGSVVKRVAYKGFTQNLHAGFVEPAWGEALGRLGVEWQCDAGSYVGPQRRLVGTDWKDFHDVDLVLAVRPPQRDSYVRKPATKLYNAWLAGVPAILGVEYAYCELRRTELDYLEASSPGDALRAVERLIGEPRLYEAMVENGHARAKAFTADAILRQWVDLLYNTIPQRSQDIRIERWRRRPLWLKSGTRRFMRLFRS